MKHIWTMDELIQHWTLELSDIELIDQTRTAKNRLGFALLLKWFQYEGRFPRRKQDVPTAIVEFLAHQLDTTADALRAYAWEGRTIERHRALVRQHLGFREATVQDSEKLTVWLIETMLPHERKLEPLIEAIYERCRALQLEPGGFPQKLSH